MRKPDRDARLHEATLYFHTHTWFFFRLSIASVDCKQHLSEIVFSALVGIFIVRNMMERFGFRVVPVHPGLVTSYYGVQEVGVTVFGVQHVLAVRIRLGNQIVPLISLQWKSEERTKHYLKCCLPSTEANDRRETNSRMRMKIQGHLMEACFFKIHQIFAKKKKHKIGYFSNSVVKSIFHLSNICANWKKPMLVIFVPCHIIW